VGVVGPLGARGGASRGRPGQVHEGTQMLTFQPLTASQLRRAARRMGKRKAAGADGLQAGDWQSWPWQHWETLARLVQLCEAEGYWPE
jgi:hypothetical protein